MKLRAPAVPLITVDPYFSIWSQDTTLNYDSLRHWTGSVMNLYGCVCIDGKKLSLFGLDRNTPKIDQTGLEIDALSTTATFETETVKITAKFTTPLLPDDLDIMTRPVSYLALSYESKDGAAHDVVIKMYADQSLCLDKLRQSPVVAETVELDGVKGLKIGNTVQEPLNRDGDDLRIDWGYFYMMAKGDAETDIIETSRTTIKLTVTLAEKQEKLLLFAYDDLGCSIQYFGKNLPSYWNKDGKKIDAAIVEAANDYAEQLAKCNAFAEKLYADANKAGGEKYAEMLALAYRQVIAAHKVAVDENGEILFISKECFSNGCAATVDVSYPSIPLFLIYNPELVKGMMRPIYKYEASDLWQYDFAPHDAGRYPLVNGQVYGMNSSDPYKYQMPVEECGNMLVMEANVALATGSADYAASHLDVLKKWCKYLVEFGEDPGNQLCTDDFAGHLAHNCNLSLKAIMGLEGMSIIMGMLGEKAEAADYHEKAVAMAESWMERAANGDGSTRLAFDQPDTYSMKYNMVWDKVWGSGIFSQEFKDAELCENRKHFNKYGMPLDSRCDYTKTDWMVWTATMESKKRDFESYIAPLYKTYNETVSRAPMTDWYDTKSAYLYHFRNRTVQGGLYIKLLDSLKICKK